MKKVLMTAGLFCAVFGINEANAACGDIESSSTCSTEVTLNLGALVVVHGISQDTPINLTWDGTNTGTTTAFVPVCIGTNANTGAVSVESTSAYQLTGAGSTSGPIPYTLAWGSNDIIGDSTNGGVSDGVVALDQCTSPSTNPQDLTVTVQNVNIASADSGIEYSQTLELVIAPD